MLNPETGEVERVIRKRMRKTQNQLRLLNEEFESNPHWTKETLLRIAERTSLTEAQVYKWGWDMKRKKFGNDEAEKMRQYEHALDQRNAQRAGMHFKEQISKIKL